MDNAGHIIDMPPATCKAIVYAHAESASDYAAQMPKTADPVDVLTRLLDDRGWKQRDLAERIHRDERTISRWMTGETKLTERMVRRVFAQLNIAPEPYGLEPLAKTAPEQTQPLDELTAGIERIQRDTRDLPLLAARIELIARDLRDIRTHLGIALPTQQEQRT